MSHDHGGSTAAAECKSEMLWNWYTIDACFLSKSWHITNNAMFVASCIGVAVLVVGLEFLRRLGKEHDAYLLRTFQRRLQALQALQAEDPGKCCDEPQATALPRYATFRASPLQQLCRAMIHGATLGVAYIIMLLAMHYNGYIIISIIIGAALGKFLCDWMVVRMPYGSRPDKDERNSTIETAGPTGCCA